MVSRVQELELSQLRKAGKVSPQWQQHGRLVVSRQMVCFVYLLCSVEGKGVNCCNEDWRYWGNCVFQCDVDSSVSVPGPTCFITRYRQTCICAYIPAIYTSISINTPDLGI